MGIFGKLFGALKKTKDGFAEKMRQLFSRNKLGDEFYEDLEEVLISADVSVSTAEKVVEGIKERAKAEKLKDPDYVTGLLKEVLTDMLKAAEVSEIEYPCVIMVVGVNGVGKTTTIGKLAHRLKKEGKTVMLAAADTFRAAAAEQLVVWGERNGVNVIRHQEGADPSAVIYDAVQSAKAKHIDVLICDTAGRLQNKKNLMNELEKMNKIITREFPEAHRETLLVLDATTGKNAVSQAQEFGQVADITGIVITKLDGTAKGGIAVTIADEFNMPIKFIGVGEGIEALEAFDPEQFIGGIFNE